MNTLLESSSRMPFHTNLRLVFDAFSDARIQYPLADNLRKASSRERAT
jgi:hypothetical protein